MAATDPFEALGEMVTYFIDLVTARRARAFVYGLGAMGEAGVTKALQIIHKELDITMAFCGHTNIQNVGTNILLPGTYDFKP